MDEDESHKETPGEFGDDVSTDMRFNCLIGESV
jgi:hypothetical protein